MRIGAELLRFRAGQFKNIIKILILTFMACCYIIYSVKINKFYIGASHEAFDARMLSHLNSKYGSQHFTSQVNDWEPFLVIDVNDYSQAIRLERKIKGMKSRTYISNLKKYPELLQRIIDQTHRV